MGNKALLPLEIFKSTSIYAICVFAFMTRVVMFVFIYYLPIFYQAVRGRNATSSGINIIPLMVSTVIALILSGRLISRFGYYWCAF